jgi:arylsulfatase A-like enzyme
MDRPNLLFLFTDEQRADTMAAYGNRRIQTPHLNRLAESSTVFERAYVTQPICTPSRSSILTGLYPHTNGCTANNIPLRAETETVAEMLPEGRFVTGYFGKWHLGDEIFRQHGFDQWQSIEDMYIEYYSAGRDRSARSDYHHWLTARGIRPQNGDCFARSETARLAEALSRPAFLAEQADRFIRAHRQEPFVLFVNFLEPHMPFFGPRDAQHDPADIALPANFDDPPTDDQPLRTRVLAEYYFRNGHSGLPLRTEADWRRMIANYWGLCSLVDTHVGRILATLEACGLTDRTVVAYTSDHGDMMGSHRLLAKSVMFEEAVRVPLLVRLPGQDRPRRVQGAVSQIDLVPTLLDLLGVAPPPHLQGRSLRATLAAGQEPAGDVFIEWTRRACGLCPGTRKDEPPAWAERFAGREALQRAGADPARTVITPDGWKFNCSPAGEHELYDLTGDPWERCNLAGRSCQRSRMQDLLGRLQAWQAATDDELELPATL